MFTTINIKDKEYRLALTTSGCIQMEKALGINPLQVFMDIDEGNIPKLGDLVIMFKIMLQKFNHGMNDEAVYNLVDDYLEEGHNMFDLLPVLIEVFTEAGFINKPSEESEEQDPNA